MEHRTLLLWSAEGSYHCHHHGQVSTASPFPVTRSQTKSPGHFGVGSVGSLPPPPLRHTVPTPVFFPLTCDLYLRSERGGRGAGRVWERRGEDRALENKHPKLPRQFGSAIIFSPGITTLTTVITITATIITIITTQPSLSVEVERSGRAHIMHSFCTGNGLNFFVQGVVWGVVSRCFSSHFKPCEICVRGFGRVLNPCAECLNTECGVASFKIHPEVSLV